MSAPRDPSTPLEPRPGDPADGSGESSEDGPVDGPVDDSLDDDLRLPLVSPAAGVVRGYD